LERGAWLYYLIAQGDAVANYRKTKEFVEPRSGKLLGLPSRRGIE
jgi:hypothetical protein